MNPRKDLQIWSPKIYPWPHGIVNGILEILHVFKHRFGAHDSKSRKLMYLLETTQLCCICAGCVLASNL